MRRFRAGLVAVALVAAAASGYSYSSYAKWPSSPVIFYVNPATPDLSPASAAAAAQFALDVWNTQGASPFRFEYGGTSSVTSTGYDGRNLVVFRNASSSSAIATTYSWWDSSNRLVDSDVVVWDASFTFFVGTSGCGGSNGAYLEDILTHEFGHALGLNHSAAADATMYPSYSYCSQTMRTLASDDIAGVQSLYGVQAGGSLAQMSTPTPGATLAGSSQTFTWTAGNGVSEYWLDVGATAGGKNLFGQSLGSSLTATVTGLPTDGRTIYVRLWSKLGSWEYKDYTYIAANTVSVPGGLNPAITTPIAGATLAGSSQTFAWSPGSGATSFYLYLGSGSGRNDLFERSLGAGLTVTASGLPTDGRKIYARLWWVRNGAWEYADTTYTAASTAGPGPSPSGNPAITSPAAGSTLSGSSQTFAWTPGTGALGYWLYVGSGTGRNDLFERSVGTSLSVTVPTLPADGRTIYVRLWWLRNGSWEYADSSYKAAVR
jgi:hypothetical protein